MTAELFKTLVRNLPLFPIKSGSTYLLRLIGLGCLSVCIPLILISAVYYHHSMQAAVDQIKKDSGASLLMSKDRVERILQGIEQLSLQLSMDPAISGSFLDPDFPDKTLEHMKILQTFTVTKNTNDFIDDIIFYGGAANCILSNDYGNIQKEWYKHSAKLDVIMQQDKQVQWTFLTDNPKGTLAFVRQLPVNKAGQPRGLFVITLNSALVEKYLESPLSQTAGQSVLVLDPQGHTLLQAGEGRENLMNNTLLKSILEDGGSESSLLADDGKGGSFLYQVRKTAFGRSYISIVAEDVIRRQITWIRSYMISVVLIFLTVGVLMTLITSVKVYNPVKQLTSFISKLSRGRLVHRYGNEFAFIRECLDLFRKETEVLERDMEKLEPTIKERFYRQLIEEKSVNRQLLDARPRLLPIPEQTEYVVLVVALGEFYKETRFTADDGPILTFVIKNVLNELLSGETTLKGEIIHDSQGRGVAVLHTTEYGSDREITDNLRRFAETVRLSMQQYLKLSVAVGIGRVYSSLSDVPVSYNEALLALQYRIYREQDAVLMIQELENHRKQAPFYYPSELEAVIVDALHDGNVGGAELGLKDFMKGVSSSESYNTVSQCYHLLLGAIIGSLASKPWVSFMEVLDHHLFDRLKKLETPSGIYGWFVQELFPLYIKLTDKTRTANSLVSRVCAHIKEHVQEDISLVRCSELISVNPSYLSRLFKKETGMTFLDYVLHCKVEEAKRLISETNLSIAEVADAIGYSERNLVRVFQKFTHMTPVHYRTMQRNS